MTQISESHWLPAHHDSYATLYTFSSCICTADLYGDGDYRLLVADLGTTTHGMKLKVFKGPSLQSEHTLVDLPTAVVAFHMDTCGPKAPAVAVASGPCIYVYKNMRPFYKFTLPTLPVHNAELEAWAQVKQGNVDVLALREALEAIRSETGLSNLTARSQRYLMLDEDELECFIALHRELPLKKQTVVTTLSTLKKSMSEEDALSCLVLGTENMNIYVLEPDAFTILAAMTVPSVPSFMDVAGLFDVEFHIVTACRDSCIYLIKRGQKAGKLCVELGCHAVDLRDLGGNIVVACMDDTLRCYSLKGKCLWKVVLQGQVVAMDAFAIRHLGLSLVAVTLSTCDVQMYHDSTLIDTIKTDDVIGAIKFGRFGREENALVMIGRGGGLSIKILKRNARLKASEGASATAQQVAKWSIPKKTKLFVDQTMRERQQFVSIHHTFQQDLQRLRLIAARSFVQALGSSAQPISSSSIDRIKLSAQVQGLGPTFMLRIQIQNTSSKETSKNLFLVLNCNSKIYSVQRSYIQVPFLVPGLMYEFDTQVRCVSESNIADIIKVFVAHVGNPVPIVTALVQMPMVDVI
ncbi:Bardet-Biedl syndrome 1 protein-like [Ornithodoros turicata]|uniref:Bardet-Biedl syndrome 1 protein-like n=1 Tax=Ornithodoros turicata TaxID=34597 RepID=UPI003138E530